MTSLPDASVAVVARPFFEHHPHRPLARRALAEAIGTALLAMVVAGSGFALRGSGAVGLVTRALASGGVLAGLVVAFGPVSGGHFNPLITLVQWLARERRTDCMLAYIAGQCLGAVAGVCAADLVFGGSVGAVDVPTVTARAWAGEYGATFGLLAVVQLVSRGHPTPAGPFAVGAWLAGAIVATPTHGLANPALAVAALMGHGPLSTSLQDVARYLPVEFAGAWTAYLITRWLSASADAVSLGAPGRRRASVPNRPARHRH